MSARNGLIIGESITSPQAGSTLVATEPGLFPNETEINIYFRINTSIAGRFLYGFFDANGDAIEGLTASSHISAGMTAAVSWLGVLLPTNAEIKIISENTILTAIVQATLNYQT